VTLVRTKPGQVWRVILDRAEARNAMSAPMLQELSRALADAGADPGARVVVLSGQGPDFSAGADLAELEAAVGGPEYGRDLEEVLAGIAQHPLPVIAELRGAALGAGCQIAVTCDLAVAATDARLGIPSSRRSSSPPG